MGNPLRYRRSPRDFAASGQVIDFKIKISDVERLAAIVEGDLEALDPDKLPSGWRDREVSGRVCFGFADAQNDLPRLEGNVSTTVDAVCQRCLEPMVLQLSVDLRLLFADDGEEAADEGYERWELEEENVRPLDLIEEALIMALPLAATHSDSKSCRAPADEGTGEVERVRPFASLRAQMDREN